MVPAGTSQSFTFSSALGQHFTFDAFDTDNTEYYADFYPTKQNGEFDISSPYSVTYSESGDVLCRPTLPVTALSLANGGSLHDLLFRYVGTGIESSSNYCVTNVQFFQCQNVAFQSDNASLYAGNVLMSQVGVGFCGQNFNVWSEQLTCDQATNLAWDTAGGSSSLSLTNALLTSVGSLGNTAYYPEHVAQPSGSVYQTAAGGNYYLADNTYRGQGTPNISPGLLATLPQKTTYPPIVFANQTFSTATNFAPRAARDTGAPDLGYLYNPLDYVFAGCTAGSNMNFSAGTAVGWYRTTSGWFYAGQGILIGNQQTLTFSGTATQPDYWVRCNAVQEDDMSGGYGPGGITSRADQNGPYSNAPTVNAEFLKSICVGMWGENAYRDDGGFLIGRFDNCEFYSCGIGSYVSTYFFTNCLFYRANAGVWQGSPGNQMVFQNCTLSGGNIYLTPTNTLGIAIKACSLDGGATISAANLGANSTYANYDYNASSSATDPFPFQGGHDTNIASFGWQTGPLGNFYLPANSALINRGSTNANFLGLYEFTTQTNQVKESNSVVDIGYHYVATDQYGNPLDTYTPNSPDYLADVAGNGMDTNGLPYWWEGKYFFQVGLDTNSDPDNSGSTLLTDYQNGLDPNFIQFSLQFTNTYVNTTTAHGSLVISGGIPFYEAALINDSNTTDAVWQPYPGTNLSVSLPASNGTYAVQIGLRGLPNDAVQTWLPILLTLRTNGPSLVITNPSSPTVTIPRIQLQGAADEPLHQLTFAVSNAMGIVNNQSGYVTDQFYDTNLLAFTTNYFQCYDIHVTNGLNTITLQASDRAGNTTTTNFNFTLDYSGATNPVLSVVWPQNGTLICGSSFTFQGFVDDATATVTAQIVDTNGDATAVQGLVERNGKIFVNNLPMSAGTNILTIAATNAAGYSTTTNLTLIQSSVTITMDALSSDQANRSSVSVTGTISDPSGDVCIQVNGTNGYYLDDLGDWGADNVPVSPAGTVTFDVELYTNDPVNIGSEIITPSAPTTITMMTYATTYNSAEIDFTSEPGSGSWENDHCNWSYASGGSDFGNLFSVDGSASGGTSWNDPIPSGIGDFSAIPKNGYLAGSFYYFTIETNYFDTPYGYCGSDSYQADTEMMIVPPDQQPPDGTACYLVEASAMLYTNGNDAADEYSGEVPAPPETLSINGQPMFNSGVTKADGSVSGLALVSGPSAAPVGLTIKGPANNLVSITNLAVSNALQIVDLNTGNVVSNPGQPETVIVGRQMNLLFQLSTTNQNIVTSFPLSGFKWTVPGYAISNYVVAPDMSSAMVVTNFPLNNSNVVFYWVDGATNRIVQCSATVDGKIASAEAMFNIVRPSATIATRTTSVGIYLLNQDQWILFDDPSGPGITFSNSISTPTGFSGSVQWVQVDFNPVSRLLDTNSAWHTNQQNGLGPFLDTTYPYQTVDASGNPVDTPGLKLPNGSQFIKGEESDEFEMWMMYHPDGGIPVPLRAVNWSWSGSATNFIGLYWNLESASNSRSPASFDTQSFPLWNSNVTNHQIVPPVTY